MIRAAGLLLLAGYLPGALIYRGPFADPERRAALDAGERAFWAVAISLAITLAAGLALALLGQYSLTRVLAFDALVAVAAGAIGWRQPLRRPRWPSPWIAGPILLVALCLWLYPPPSEYVLGGKDPGVYMNAGIQIAQRGGVITYDPVVASLPAEFRDLFFPPHGSERYYSSRFMGFFLMDPASGAVIDQFPHLYPTAIALAYDIAGLTGARYASIVLATLGVVSLYFLGARLAGRPAGLTAAGLLAIHVVQLWHARVPNSEILMQPLLLGGLLACARAHYDDDLFFAPVAALLFGLLPFTRLDGLLAVAFLGAGLGAWWMTGGRVRARLVLPLAALLAAFLLYAARFLAPYASIAIVWVSFNRVYFACLAVIAAALWLIGLRLRSRRTFADGIRAYLPVLLSAVLIALAAYAWFIRAPGGRLAAHDAGSLHMFAWYVHPAAIAAALAGFVLLARNRFWKDPTFFVLATSAAVFFFYRIRIVPEHFWASRRFVPILLPSVLLCVGAALLMPLRSPAGVAGRVTRWARYALRLALLALIAASFWMATAAIRHHVEYAGVIPGLEQLAGRLAENDLLVVESRNSSDLHVLALPLAYIYNRPVLVLTTPRPERTMFATFVRWARARYGEVYFLGGGGTDLLSRDIGVVPVHGGRIEVPEYDSPLNAYPTEARVKKFGYGLYRFVSPEAGSDVRAIVDIGAADDLHVLRFHAKERDARGTYRWTRDISYLVLTGLSADWRSLVLWMENGGRPAQAPPAAVEVSIDGNVLGRVTVGQKMQPYTVPIPPAVAQAAAASPDPVTIRLETTIWNPRDLLGVADDRELGVMVDKVEVRSD